jgi:imidazolonepropionase-like amidohydrolase
MLPGTLRSSLCALPLALAFAQPRPIAITGVTLIDGTGAPPRANVTIVIQGDRIASVGKAAPAKATLIDGANRFAIPGLWDMHTHLAYAGDVTATLLVAHGVTSVRDPGGSLDTVDWLRRRIQNGALIGPRIFRSGPVVDGSKPGAQDRLVVDTAADARHAVRFLKSRGVDFIKVHTGVPRDAYFALLDEARQNRLPVVGHIPNDVDPAAAVEAGHHSVEHVVTLFEGAVRRKTAAGMTQRQAIAEFTDDEARKLARLMAAKGAWFDPTLVTYWYRAHQFDLHNTPDPREKYVTASLRAFWKTLPQSLTDTPETRRALADAFDRFLAITRIFHREGVRMLTGTDLAVPFSYAGSTLHEELAWLVKAGLTPMEAIVAATRHGAEAVGRGADLGTIAEGKRADLVLLDANPLDDIRNVGKIAAVIAAGRPFDRRALDDVLADMGKLAPSR